MPRAEGVALGIQAYADHTPEIRRDHMELAGHMDLADFEQEHRNECDHSEHSC